MGSLLTGRIGRGAPSDADWGRPRRDAGRIVLDGSKLMDTATVERLSGALASRSDVSEATRAVVGQWLSDPAFEVFRPEIAELIESGRWAELEDAFYTQLTVGTGGIRGRVGP